MCICAKAICVIYVYISRYEYVIIINQLNFNQKRYKAGLDDESNVKKKMII